MAPSSNELIARNHGQLEGTTLDFMLFVCIHDMDSSSDNEVRNFGVDSFQGPI